MKFQLYFFLIFFVFSCSLREQQNQASDLDQFKLRKVDELSIKSEPPLRSTFQLHQILNDSIFYGLNPFDEPNTLTLFDIKQEKFIRQIKIDPNLFKIDMMSFHVHSVDSIFFHTFSTKDIYLINGNGDQINHWDLSQAGGEKYRGTHGYFLTFAVEKNIDFINSSNLLVLPISDNYFHEEAGDSGLPKVLLFDISQNEIVGFMAPPFGRMKNRGNLKYPGDMQRTQFVLLKDQLYVSYPFDDEIAIFDLKTGSMVKSENPFRKLELMLYEPKSPDVMADRTQSWEFRVEMPFFEGLFYHHNSGVFSRIYHHPYSSENDTDKTYIRKSTILYFDHELNPVGNTEFEAGQLGVFRNIPLSQGFLSAESDFFINSEDLFIHKNVYKFQKL